MYVVCPFVLFLLTTVFSVLRYTHSYYPFGIVKLLSSLSLDCQLLIFSSVSNVYLDIYSDISNITPLFSVFSELRSEVITRFVEIDGVVDHHCLNFLFLIVIETKRMAK